MKEEKVLIGFFWGRRRRSVGESFLLSDSSLSLAIKYKTDFLAFFKFYFSNLILLFRTF